MKDKTEQLKSVIFQLKRFNELNGADIRLVYETLEHYLRILKEVENGSIKTENK
jgi:hypothetical protein